jgi:hypothetical protein
VIAFFNPAHPGPAAGLFRPGEHVLVVPQGSAMAILDLERGVMYATTPLGAESWDTLVGGARPARQKMVEGQSGPVDDEGAQARAQMAAYLLDCRIIEAVTP